MNKEFKWKCTNCEEEFRVFVNTEEFSEDFEINEWVAEEAKEHIADCMDWQEFYKPIGIKK